MGLPSLSENILEKLVDATFGAPPSEPRRPNLSTVPSLVADLAQARRELAAAQRKVRALERQLGVVHSATAGPDQTALDGLKSQNGMLRWQRDQARAESRSLTARVQSMTDPTRLPPPKLAQKTASRPKPALPRQAQFPLSPRRFGPGVFVRRRSKK